MQAEQSSAPGANSPCMSPTRRTVESTRRMKAWKRNVHKKVGCITAVDQLAKIMRLPTVHTLMDDQAEDDDDWLAQRTLQALNLELDTIKEESKIRGQDVPPVYSDEKLAGREDDLSRLLASYQSRLQWLGQGSRGWFGLVRARSVALLLDCSSTALLDSAHLKPRLLEALHMLLGEQLAKKAAVHLIRLGDSPTHALFLDFTLDKYQATSRAEEWLDRSADGEGTCNLLAGLKLALRRDPDTVCCVLTRRPDQDCDLISDYLLQVMTGFDRPKLHFVSCGSDPATRQMMKFIVREVGGVYHHNNLDEEMSFQDSVVDKITSEMEKVQWALQGVRVLRSRCSDVRGRADQSTVTAMYKMADSSLDSLAFLCTPLRPQDGRQCSSGLDRLSSREWLCCHGIEARGLDYYGLLQPDSYQPKMEVVPATGGTVQSQVYNVMLEEAWPDGSRRRIHVDLPKVEEYMEHLERAVGGVQQRIEGLTLGSREKFGIITEESVVLLVSTPSAMSGHLLELQQSLKSVLQEQFLQPLGESPVEGKSPGCRKLNVGQFSSSCSFWSQSLSSCSEEGLEGLWQWVSGWLCGGTVNLAAALVATLDMLGTGLGAGPGEEVGVYVITSAHPDQEKDLLCSWLAEAVCGHSIRVHAVFLELAPPHSPPLPLHYHAPLATAECLLQLVDCGYGQFHHWADGEVVYSDSLFELQQELDLMLSYQKKVVDLMERFKRHCQEQSAMRCKTPTTAETLPTSSGPLPLYPRQTLTSVTRLNLCSRRSSVGSGGEGEGGRRGSAAPDRSCCRGGFYLGRGIRKGYLATRDSNKGKSPVMDLKVLLSKARSKHCSSAKWLDVYGLQALRLALDRLKTPGPSPHTFAHPGKNGGVAHLVVDRAGLLQYARDLKTCSKAYSCRLEWASQESRAWFGCVPAGGPVAVLVDTSASTAPHLSRVTDMVYRFVTEQLLPRRQRFACGTFGGTVKWWRDEITMVTRDVLGSLQSWLNGLSCHGNTRLLEAVEEATGLQAAVVYLLSDGRQDHSEEYFVQHLDQLALGRTSVCPVGLFLVDRRGGEFLKSIAERTGGSYHTTKDRHLQDRDDMADDVRLLQEEIRLARHYTEAVQELL